MATQTVDARQAPLDDQRHLDERKSSFRELILGCSERSKSLSCHRAGIYYIQERGDYRNGIEYLNQACKLGRGYSCTVLGNYYKEGKIVPKDLWVAKTYYNKGCIRKSDEGCKNYKETIVPPPVKKFNPLDILNQ